MKKIISCLFLAMLTLTACEAKVVKPTLQATPPPAVPLVQTPTQTPDNKPVEKITSNSTKTFTNNKCNYNFKYLNDAEVLSNDPIGFKDDSADVFVNLKGEGRLINISCYSSDEDLKTYAQNVWQINKDDMKTKVSKTVGDMEETSFQGEGSYKFSVTDTYKYHDGGGEVLKNPTSFLFTQHNNQIYEIAYLTGNKNSKEILDSFKFN